MSLLCSSSVPQVPAAVLMRVCVFAFYFYLEWSRLLLLSPLLRLYTSVLTSALWLRVCLLAGQPQLPPAA
jgi:hypothetical protein